MTKTIAKVDRKDFLWTVVFAFFLFSASEVSAEIVCPFSGQIDFGQKKLILTVTLDQESSVSLEGTALPKDNYHFLVNVNHFKTPVFDFSTQLETFLGVNHRNSSGNRSWQGQVTSRYSLINYKPFRELSGNFEMKDRKLYLESLSLGGVTLNGYIEMIYPFKMDLSFLLSEIQLADFLNFWGVPEEIDSEGFVSGQILVSGILDQMGVSGNLASYNGQVDQLQFDSIVVNLGGFYPVIHLSNSKVTQSDGMTFKLAGNLDLSQQEEFPQQIAALKMSPLVNEDKSSMEWTIKSAESQENSRESEFKYFMRKEQSDPGIEKGQSELLGVESSFKF